MDGDYTQMGANPEVLLHVGPAVCDKVEVTGTATLNPGQLVFFLNNFQGNAAVTYVPMIYNAHVGTFQNNPPTWTLGGVLYGAIYKNTELDLKSPPLAGTAPNINTVEGTNVTTVATFTDPAYATPPPPSNYTAVIDWGDGSASQGLVSGGGGSYSVGPASPHAYQKDGSYTTEVVITDNMAPTRTVTLSGSATITEAPLSSSGRPFSAVAGQPFAGVVASFTDGDSAAQPSDFQAMITWGDGTQSTPGVIQSSGGSSFNVTGAHTYASRGSYFFSVMISEVAGGMSTTATGMATVSAGALDEVLAALAAATQDQAAVPAQPSNPITPVSDALAADALFEQLTLAATT